MTVLVTGAAGFIGFHVVSRLLQRGEIVIGLDNLNNYYDVTLKQARLQKLRDHSSFSFHRLDLADRDATATFFAAHPDITHIVHLAAQAGVRYSLQNPFAYADANLLGHLAILEGARHLKNLKHLVYASSSSVYGANTKLPFSVEDPVNHPMSLYAVTKRANELMSECYTHLYHIPTTGLRFFTVYGPWGRPDMSAFIFTKAILAEQEMPVFNQGKMRRNFTYVDDIVTGVVGCLDAPTPQPCHRMYNIGNNKSEDLMRFIHVLEDLLGKKARIRFEPLQPGDVPETIADIDATTRDFGFAPQTNIEEGLAAFVDWYRQYYS